MLKEFGYIVGLATCGGVGLLCLALIRGLLSDLISAPKLSRQVALKERRILSAEEHNLGATLCLGGISLLAMLLILCVVVFVELIQSWPN